MLYQHLCNLGLSPAVQKIQRCKVLARSQNIQDSHLLHFDAIYLLHPMMHILCSQNSKQLFLFSKSKLQLLKAVPRLHFSNCKICQPSRWTVLPVRGPFAGLRTVALLIVCRSVGRQSEARQSLGQYMHRMVGWSYVDPGAIWVRRRILRSSNHAWAPYTYVVTCCTDQEGMQQI